MRECLGMIEGIEDNVNLIEKDLVVNRNNV